jgi:cell division protease FtsH
MDFGFTKPYSEKTAELIDQEVKEIIEESYVRAQEVLKKNIKGLTELAELLLEKEVIFSEDLERIFGKRKADFTKEAETSSLVSSPDQEKTVVSPKSEPELKNSKNENKEGSGSDTGKKAERKKPSKKPKVEKE